MDAELLYCGELLIKRGLTIAFAESATAGQLAADFSLVPDAGKFLKGALVCYDASLKEDLLKVPKGLIEAMTPESMEVTKAITAGLSALIPADIHVGITGLTCPGGSESRVKPIGTIFIHCNLYNNPLFSERIEFAGDPQQIVRQTVLHTAKLLVENIT